MAHLEVTHQSWFQRQMNSLLAMLVGIALVIGACCLLFWNEGRAVKTTQALDEGARVVQSLPSPEKMNPAMEGRLVHVTGMARTDCIVRDPVLNLSLNCLNLQRCVEYYQWVEEKESETYENADGGTTTYTRYSYSQRWVEEPVSSSQFKEPGHHNTVACRFSCPDIWLAPDVRLGDFRLNPGQVSRAGVRRPVNLAQLELPDVYAGRAVIDSDFLYIGSVAPPVPANPSVGDVRIRWVAAESECPVSLVAQQSGNSFKPYKAESGYTVDLLQDGLHTAPAMFEKALSDNILLTWFLRGGGAILMFFGVLLLFQFLKVLCSIIPLVGSMVEAGIFVVSVLIALSLSLIVIAAAWFFYRPLLAACIIFFGAMPLYYIIMKRRRKAA